MARSAPQNVANPSHIAPTDERRRQGLGVELLLETIADDEGRISQPHRAIDLLKSYSKREAITPEERSAGERFQRDYYIGYQRGILHAYDVSRVLGSRGQYEESHSMLRARERVWDALAAVGHGTASPFFSLRAGALWSVIGWGKTIEEWTKEAGIYKRLGSKLLIEALQRLALHYGKT